MAVALPDGPRNGCYLRPDKSQTSHTCPVHGHPTPCQVSVADGPILGRNCFQRRVALCGRPVRFALGRFASQQEASLGKRTVANAKTRRQPRNTPIESPAKSQVFLCVVAMFLLKMWPKCAVCPLFGWGAVSRGPSSESAQCAALKLGRQPRASPIESPAKSRGRAMCGFCLIAAYVAQIQITASLYSYILKVRMTTLLVTLSVAQIRYGAEIRQHAACMSRSN